MGKFHQENPEVFAGLSEMIANLATKAAKQQQILVDNTREDGSTNIFRSGTKLSPSKEEAMDRARMRAIEQKQSFEEENASDEQLDENVDRIADRYIDDFLEGLFGK